MTRTLSPSRNSPTSWAGYKELARRQYDRGEYEAATKSYISAMNPEYHCPSSEQQIILSNLVACRLKIGGTAQARAAVDNAKQCVELNPRWAKGYVRLASAYIALGGHSNDACNALQSALSIDPGNSLAREMLVRELRRDHAHASRASSTATSPDSASDRGAPPEDNNPSFTDREDARRPTQNNANNNYRDDTVDESLTWQEWLQFHFSRVRSWYQGQSDDVKTACKIALAMLFLYVAFGGRFGLGGNTRRLGNYDSDNVYDHYRRTGTTRQSRRQRTSNNYENYGRHYDETRYYNTGGYHNNNPGGWGGYSFFDGGFQSMLLLGGLFYGAHLMGMNPFHTMMLMNVLGGGRRRFRPRGGFGMGMGGFGVGPMGFGGMGGRMRYGGDRRRF